MRSFLSRSLALFTFLVATVAHAAEPAWVANINGTPTLSRAGKAEPLQRGAAIQVGDTIETNEASKVKLLLADDSVLAIGPRSRVTLEAFDLDTSSRKARLRVLAGRFKLAVSKFFGGPTDYEVATPTAVAGVRGTVRWGDTELDAICALDGRIKVRPASSKKQPSTLNEGKCVSQMAAGKLTPLQPSPADLARYLREVTLD
ncbi:MAG: FecR domain-containing protein [Deltaproteobacteria bacterium]|nr:FecR domain-containing protein [Deltaproteobacteria bacterium]